MDKIYSDICVIGGGSGGLSVASAAAQLGLNVVLIEGNKMGGDCLNYGCIPSKSLISASKSAYVQTKGEAFGITSINPKVEFAKVKEHILKVIKTIEPHDSVERFEKLGVKVIESYGKFISNNEVLAGNKLIKARRFVIATGSEPFIPKINGIDKVKYYTNKNIFEISECPKHLIVIGGGPIGIEIAQAYVRLGAQVTVLEAKSILEKDDPESVKILVGQLKKDGIKILENSEVVYIENDDKNIKVRTSDGSIYKGSHLLIAAGREPNIKYLDLVHANVDHSKRNIKVDAFLKTSNKRVFAIGDVTGERQFTHTAEYHAGIIIRSAAFGLKFKQKKHHIPWTTYSDPEISQVGLNEAQAYEKYGKKISVVKVNYSDNDRAITELETIGFVKVMVFKGRPIGASIVGKNAGEIIQIWCLAISSKLKMSAISSMVSPYPTLGELNKRVSNAYLAPKLINSLIIKRFVRFIQKL
ncbi:MAG: FAD-dependent oxidoreductase [Amylibacter sp.]|nr:FAD-dependent oxidoreductase [Amylibacter sp.]